MRRASVGKDGAMANGHIRQRGKASWELKFDVGSDPATGKRRTHYATVKGTKRDAQRELRRLMGDVDNNTFVEPSKVTLAQFVHRWDVVWAVSSVSPRTHERYLQLLRGHVVSRIGNMPMQKVEPLDLVTLYATLAAEGGKDPRGNPMPLSARSVGHVHRVLHRLFGHAVEWKIRRDNPVAAVSPPRVEAEEVVILDDDKAAHVLKAVQGRAIYPIAALALATGMRRGEIAGLRWCDIDLDRSELKVAQSVEVTRAGLRIKMPKTKHGRRTISLPAWMVATLRTVRRERQEQALVLGIGRVAPEAFVFGNVEGDPCNPDVITRGWIRALDALDIPRVTFHSLRHTHASQLIAAGMDVLTVSRRLGHGSPAITLNVYSHAFERKDTTAAAIIEAAFSWLGTE